MMDPRDFEDDDTLAKCLLVVAILAAWGVALVKYLHYCQGGIR